MILFMYEPTLKKRTASVAPVARRKSRAELRRLAGNDPKLQGLFLQSAQISQQLMENRKIEKEGKKTYRLAFGPRLGWQIDTARQAGTVGFRDGLLRL